MAEDLNVAFFAFRIEWALARTSPSFDFGGVCGTGKVKKEKKKKRRSKHSTVISILKSIIISLIHRPVPWLFKSRVLRMRLVCLAALASQ